MKIAIVGPGATGLLLASFFLRSKEDIWILDKDAERAARLRKNGIRVDGLTHAKIPNPNVTASARELSDAAFWFLCVKSYDTKPVLKQIGDFVSDGAFIASLQNGLGNTELLAECFGARRVIAGATGIGALLTGEGTVRHSGEGEVVLARIDGIIGAEMKDLRELFRKSKIPLKISKDINGVLWSKLVINVGINALSALLKVPNGRIHQSEGARRIFREAITEAVRVAKRKRVRLDFDDAVAKAESVCEATSENISSMLQDVLRRKKTEIDFLNGAVVRQGESYSIKTPVNALLVDLVKAVEAAYPFEIGREFVSAGKG